MGETVARHPLIPMFPKNKPRALGAALLGSWSLARAALRRAWPPLVGALLWWGIAATALRAPADEALLWLGLGMLSAQALPGFAVASREARQRV